MLLARAVLVPIGIALLCTWPVATLAFEEWRSYQPPPLTCSDGWIGLTFGDSGGCLQISANAKEVVSTDTAFGNSFSYDASSRGAIIVDEAGGIAGVVGFRAWHSPYWSYNASGVLVPDDDHFELSEAFISAGRGVNLRAGLLDATFDSLAASSDDFEWLTDITPADSFYGNSPVMRGGLGAQVISDSRGSLSSAIGVEGIGPHSDDGTVLGYLHFLGETGTDAKVTGMIGGLADGQVDNWSIEAFGTTKLGMLQLLSTATVFSNGDWQVLLSGKAALGPVFIAASVERGEHDKEVIGSVHLGDPELGPSLGVGGRLYHSVTADVRQVELRGSVLPLVNLQLTASVGTAESTNLGYYRGPIQYASLGATWRPTDTVQLTAQYTGNSLGGWKLAGGAEQRF